MTLEETWLAKYQEVLTFTEKNKRNPSKHDGEEGGRLAEELIGRLRNNNIFKEMQLICGKIVLLQAVKQLRSQVI